MNKDVATLKRWVPLIGGGVLLACAAFFLFRRATDQGPAEGARSGEEGETTFRGKWRLPEGARLVEPGERDLVEEASYESFPASDPPAYTPLRVG